MIGILHCITGMIYCEEHERYNANVFLGFLENILAKYPTGKIIMILDNARIHHAKLIQPFLMKVKDRLELMFLPPYRTELNLIEWLWSLIKSSIISNKFFSSLAVVKTAIHKFINEINKAPYITMDRLCIKM